MPIIHVKSEVEYNKYVSQGKLVIKKIQNNILI